ncbi:MAG: isochorismatase family protein [Deltaproteobacteria bacterium]|nr:isochorismatase family protein [Candidatus Anaeroferrophillacea bacterium]
MAGRSFCPDREESALVLVDFQDAILNTFDRPLRDRLHRQTALIIRLAQQLEIPIVVMEQYPGGLGPTNETIRVLLGDSYQPFGKKIFSGAGVIGERLRELGRRHLLVAGIEAHICVLQTAIDLIDQGYNVFLLKDAVGSRFELDWQTGCELMIRAGAVPATVQMVLFHMLEKAEGPDFKALLPYLK